MDIGKRLKEARRREGLSQSDLAEKIGVTKASIGNWERGTSPPSWSSTRKVDVWLNGINEIGIGFKGNFSDMEVKLLHRLVNNNHIKVEDKYGLISCNKWEQNGLVYDAGDSYWVITDRGHKYYNDIPEDRLENIDMIIENEAKNPLIIDPDADIMKDTINHFLMLSGKPTKKLIEEVDNIKAKIRGSEEAKLMDELLVSIAPDLSLKDSFVLSHVSKFFNNTLKEALDIIVDLEKLYRSRHETDTPYV